MTATAPYVPTPSVRDLSAAGGSQHATEVRGKVRLSLTGDGPRATLRIDDDSVHISLETGLDYTYPRESVYWNPLDEHSVRIEIGEERVFFVGFHPLDFSVLDHPDSRRRLPPLPPIGAHWTELPIRDPGPWVDPDEAPPTPWTNTVDEARVPEPARASRSRRRRQAPCAHEWRELRMPGGLTRRVCSECGELSLQSQ